jgi:hypothetical protein
MRHQLEGALTMQDRKKEIEQRTKGKPGPAQAEGSNEEVGEGLEQRPPAASDMPTQPATDPGRCEPDKGGIAH